MSEREVYPSTSQRIIIKFLVREGVKLVEIFRRSQFQNELKKKKMPSLRVAQTYLDHKERYYLRTIMQATGKKTYF